MERMILPLRYILLVNLSLYNHTRIIGVTFVPSLFTQRLVKSDN